MEICDRYPQTQYPGGNDGPLLTEWSDSRSWALRQIAALEHRAYERAVRTRPDLLLKLDIDCETALVRRPGLDPTYLQQRIDIVRALDIGCRTLVLDASLPPETVRQEATRAVLEVAGATGGSGAAVGSDHR